MKLTSALFLVFLMGLLSMHTQAQKVAGGQSHSLAVCNDSTVRAWGYNNFGQLGDSTLNNSSLPLTTKHLSKVIAVAAGEKHSLALKSDGTVWAWGRNINGQLGDSTFTDRRTPVKVHGLNNVKAIACGGLSSIALKNDGTVWCWGSNNYGQLGDSSFSSASSMPVKVVMLTGITGISGGWGHVVAVRSDGTVWAWGYNGNGQLGDGTYNWSNFPVQVAGLSGATAVAAGGYHSLALKSNGTVWAWGKNNFGQLGDNVSNTDSTTAGQVVGLSGVIAIAAGNDQGAHSVALKNDGTVWTWGINFNGQLGNNSTTSSNVPVQVSGLTGAVAIASGEDHSFALKNGGALWDWGANSVGQLGDNSTTDRHVPVQVTSLCFVSTKIGEIHAYDNVMIYPNPASSALHIKGIDQKVIVTIYDAFGRAVLSDSFEEEQAVIDVSGLAQGLYTIVAGDGHASASRRLVIAR